MIVRVLQKNEREKRKGKKLNSKKQKQKTKKAFTGGGGEPLGDFYHRKHFKFAILPQKNIATLKDFIFFVSYINFNFKTLKTP